MRHHFERTAFSYAIYGKRMFERPNILFLQIALHHTYCFSNFVYTLHFAL